MSAVLRRESVDLRPMREDDIAQEIDQQCSRRYLRGDLLSVDAYRDINRRAARLFSLH